jgi:hypothetical protein
MPAILNPIKRDWKPSVRAADPMISQFDNYEIELPLPNVLGKENRFDLGCLRGAASG